MKITSLVLASAVVVAFLSITAAKADKVAIDANDDDGMPLMGDPAHGEVLFHKCMVCHSIVEGQNRIGPSLHGIIGRHSGIIENFNYSPANKNSGIVWTPQKIFVYLKNPQATVPGTKMSFPGYPAVQDRADVIAYLEANTK